MTHAGSRRMYLAVIAVLLLVIAALAWKFIVAGSTREGGADERTVVVLAQDERALMLREMRGFVAGLQQVTDGLARDDMQAVAAASGAMGTAKAHDAPLAMLAKLPFEFKTLAFGVHRGFDTIAHDAANGGTAKHALGQLAAVLQQCAECHKRYQVNAADARSP
jgi:hypothetical protein